MEKIKMDKVKKAVPYILAGLICLVDAIAVFSNSVELDEAYSIVLVRSSLQDIVRGAAKDVHPPLYYLILKIASFLGGESLLKYRLVTALATWLNLFLLGAGMIRRRWGMRVSVFYMLWFGINYCTLEKSVLVRMYSWGAFFVTAAALFVLAYYETGKIRNFILSVFLTIAAMYTHYYAVMAVFVIWIMLLTATLINKRKMVRQVLFGGVLIAAGYLPWMGSLFSQSSRVAQDYWIKNFDWWEWFSAPASLMESSLTGIGMALYFFVFAVLILAIFRKNGMVVCCFGVFAGTMLIGALLSIFVTPIWQSRYLYVAWGMLSLGIAIIAGQNRDKISLLLQGFLLVILCMTGVFSVMNMRKDELMTSTADEWVAFLQENVAAGDCLIVDDPYEHSVVFQYYLPHAEIVMTEELEEMGGPKKLGDILSGARGKGLWYVIDYVQPRFGLEKMEEAVEKEGYSLHSYASYTIKYKDLEVFGIGEESYEK